MRQSAASALHPLQRLPPIVPAKPLAAAVAARHMIGPHRREQLAARGAVPGFRPRRSGLGHQPIVPRS